MSPTRHMASIRAASPRDVKNFCTGGGCGGLIQSFLDPHAKNLLEHEFGINPPHPPPHHTTTPPHLTTIYLLLLLNQ